MSNLTVPNLVLRSVKGAELSSSEIDGNFKTLSTFCNSLASFFGVTVGTSGELKDGSVVESMIKDRQIGANKLKLNSLPIALDSGSAGTYAIAFTPGLAAYEDGLLFWVNPLNSNVGPSTLNVNGLGAKSILKGGNVPLTAGDITANEVFAVAYYAGNFRLVAGGGIGGSSSTLSSISKNEIVTAIPANGASYDFPHGLSDVPSSTVTLRCTIGALSVPELGFADGEEVDIRDFVDVSGRPAFTITSTGSYVSVLRNVSALYVARKDPAIGTLTVTDETKWQLHIVAETTSNTAGPLFPALDIQAATPDGAMGYGQDVFFLSKGTAGKTLLCKLDMATNIVRLVYVHGSVMGGNQFNLFRTSTGKDMMVWSTGFGYFWMPTQDPGGVWAPTQFGTYGLDVRTRRVCQVDVADASDTLPTLYAVTCNGVGSTTSSVPAYKVNTTAGSSANYGTPLSLLNAGIVNSAAFVLWHPVSSNVLLFQYNPISQRIYVITSTTQMLHIFRTGTLTGDVWTLAGAFKDWWVDAARYAKLTYEKAISIASGTCPIGTTAANYSVEFDLTNGKEKAILITRETPGVVSRVPWAE